MNKSRSFDRKPRAKNLYNALAVVMTVLLPLSLTLVLQDREKDRVEREAEIEFESRVREVTDAVGARMKAYEQVLRGAAALFASSDTVTREGWREYVRLLRIAKSYPGTIAIAYAPTVPEHQLKEFITRIRKSDLRNFSIWPAGERPLYAPTVYIEPFAGRNLRALGFDIYSDTLRRVALDIARDTGEATLSGRITPAQDAGGPAQPDIAIFVPVYRRTTDPSTLAQRRIALAGFVSGGFRMNELLDDLFGERFRLDLRIYDGRPDPAVAPLAQKHPRGDAVLSAARFTAQRRLDLANRSWTLQFASTPEFDRAIIDNDRPRLVLGGGLLMSALLIAFMWSLANSRNRAVRLARQMTTELHAKQAALSKSEERLNLALQGSDLALFDWDARAGTVWLSERWATILGDAPHEAVMTITELSQLVHPEDMPRLQQELQAVLRGKSELYRVEHRVKNRRGEWIWILSSAKVVERNAEGRPLRVTGTNADITPRKQIENMKDDFVSTVSHELRTPLTAVVGALGLLCASDTPTGDDAKMLLNMAYQNSERLAALINDVLDIEKLEAGMMEMRIVPTALGPFLHRAIELNRSYADRFKVRYELHAPLPAVSMHVDPERLMQVVTNLLSNATKFSPQGAAVTIAATVDGNRVRVSVTDRGPGVPFEFRNRIFGKFVQADASTTRQQRGTGLGLAISKAIIEQLGGRIGYESEPGRGATFFFEVPLSGHGEMGQTRDYKRPGDAI